MSALVRRAGQYFHRHPGTPDPFRGRHQGEKRAWLEKLAVHWGELAGGAWRGLKGLWRPAVRAGEETLEHAAEPAGAGPVRPADRPERQPGAPGPTGPRRRL